MLQNTKAAIFLGALRRTGPEWIAAIALAWLLRDAPRLAWWHLQSIGRLVPVVWNEGRFRIPPSKSADLKGTYKGIGWINEHVPRDRTLFYLGRMSKGVRFRYYTFPRAGHWHYVYGMDDVVRAPEAIASANPAYVLMERITALKDFPLPSHWREIWHDPPNRLSLYEVMDHAAE